MVYSLCDAQGKASLKGGNAGSYGGTCSGYHFYPLLFLPVLAFVIVGVLLLRSWRYEYEYVYVNGDFEVSKIIRKEKRKDLYRCERKDMEYVTEGRKSAAGCKVRDFTSGWEKAKVYTLKVGNDLIYLEPNEEFLEEMRLHRKLK